MKYLPYITIIILLLLLVFGYLHYSNKTGKIELSNLKEKLDSAIKPHEQAIIKIQRQKKQAILKIRIDSAKHYHETQIFRKEISGLRKQLKAVRYIGNPSTVSDDSVKIAMQALKEAPLKDMLISKLDKENDNLNAHIEEMQVDYSQLMDLNQQELNQKDKIINDWKAYSEGLEKQNKTQRKKGLWGTVKYCAITGAVALGVGYVYGVSH